MNRPTGPAIFFLVASIACVAVACSGRSTAQDPDPKDAAATGGATAGGGQTQGSVGGVGGVGGLAGAAGKADGGTPGGGGHAGNGGASGGALRACKDTITQPASSACRSVNECGPTGPAKCCTAEPCWTGSAACPLPPSGCTALSNRFQCTVSSDCTPGGTCVSAVMGCPQCEYRSCQYPPPPCTTSPDSCGSTARCQTNGTCAPLSCTDGYVCAAGSRCRAGGARSDANGCELIPCDDGWTCDENTRCTAPAERSSHGCTALACTTDSGCDCGYCVNGACLGNLGRCSFPPA